MNFKLRRTTSLLTLGILAMPILSHLPAGPQMVNAMTSDSKATTVTASGKWGTAPWELTSDGTLTIHAGTGQDTGGSSPWFSQRDSITKIVIDGPLIAPADSSRLFDSLIHVTQISGLEKLNTSSVTNMFSMFFGMLNLTTLDVSSFDTSNVTNMSGMFWGMSNLTSLDLSHFDTSKVTDMGGLLVSTSSLNYLKLGPQFKFIPSIKDIILSPVPSSNQYSGKWQNVGTGTQTDPKGIHVLTSQELVAQYNGATMADTYVWQPNRQALNVRNSTLTVGDQWAAKDNLVIVTDKYGSPVDFKDVKVTGTVDTSKAGTYTIHYTYDGLDKTATVTVKAKDNNNHHNSGSGVKYQAVYRLYNKNTGEHFYTESVFERNALINGGWNNEGTGWSAPSQGTAVYRVYNPNAKGGDHYYTASQYEAQSLVKTGWKWDNGSKPVFYSGGKTPVYVAFNPNATASGSHNYTGSSFEQQSLLKNGWKFGKVQFYGK